MAKSKKVTLRQAPFPRLDWDDCFWAGKVVLPSWKGFQSRLGHYGTVSSKKPSDGTALLTISVNGNDPVQKPTPAQSAAYRYLIEHESAIQKSILREVLKSYPQWRASYFADYDLEDSEDVLPVVKRADQLRDVLGLSEVHIHTVENARVAYVGYEFGCSWESEHGLGAMMHRARVVELGGADSSILEWIAENDAKSRPSKKRRSTSG